MKYPSFWFVYHWINIMYAIFACHWQNTPNFLSSIAILAWGLKAHTRFFLLFCNTFMGAQNPDWIFFSSITIPTWGLKTHNRFSFLFCNTCITIIMLHAFKHFNMVDACIACFNRGLFKGASTNRQIFR